MFTFVGTGLASVPSTSNIDKATFNGLAIKPPMGWRSWNTFGPAVTQNKMTGVMDKMSEKKRKIWSGEVMSLLELGYKNCGLDDNWQACGTGVKGSFHDANGNPLINQTTFPNMKVRVQAFDVVGPFFWAVESRHQ